MIASKVAGVTGARTTPDFSQEVEVSRSPIHDTDRSAGSVRPRILRETAELPYLFDQRIEFNIDRDTGRIIVQLVDRDSGEIVRQVPPDEVLSIIQSVNRLLGLLFDQFA